MKNENLHKLVLTGIMAALSFIAYEFFRIPFGNTGTSFHLGNTFAALGGLMLGPIYGGFGAAIGLSLADLIAGDLIYVPTTFILKFIIGSVTGIIAHKVLHLYTQTSKSKIFQYSLIASACGLLLNVITDPCIGYVRSLVLGYEASVANIMAKIAGGVTFANSIVSTICVVILYNALRPALTKAGLLPEISAK
ncbi:MAG: ECF transporter S component [Lachnospiraceae bacterium]|nr:ECF transporter S component [Lachnospiraceae bacterium]